MSIQLHTEVVVFTSLAHTIFWGQAILKVLPRKPRGFQGWKNYPGPDYLKSWDFIGIQPPEKLLGPGIKFLQCLKSFCLAWQLDC